ncbi:peroxidase family protein [Sphingomonas aerolata]|uniref:peroxidase family protein n=1 Tax=Sphingomonas aerolata TaxID=185951 RepID=UPI00141B0657|nr:peroxidase family protein [Sphingomonas aerolata]NII57248.1 Ca2+-binding RTX toxin-like protein [Sphingomonas aerolata]
MSGDFTVDLGDLNFILAQIRISERNAAGESLADILGPQAQLIPYGLRTVDGSYNNLLPGNAVLGAADQLLPRLTTPVFRNLNDGATFGTGPGGPVLTNTDYGTPGSVVDADPRLISNLIADMTNTNPAAIAAWYVNAHAQAAYADAHGGDAPPDGYIPTNEELASIPNLSPDIGLSPSFNAWMTFFGQFFDHGLDLITKGGNGTVLIPLQPDDPLYVPGGPNFMPLTRSTQYDANGNPVVGGTETVNTTTPFIDQNQTYTSHASHQVFLREYKFSVDSDDDGVKDSHAISTGRLLDGAIGGMANWAETKAQALTMLGIRLDDYDVHNVPLLLTDAYGRFIPGANGYAQIMLKDGTLLEGTAEGVTVPANAYFTGHAFLNDIAHHAEPVLVDLDHNPATPAVRQTADTDMLDFNGDGVSDEADLVAGLGRIVDVDGDEVITLDDLRDVNLDGVINARDLIADDNNPLTYDDEMLDAHFVTGDGRGNENIGLTAVHTVFHSEHNRVVEADKLTIIASGDLAIVNEWLRPVANGTRSAITQAELDAIEALTGTAKTLAINALDWDGERLFQAGRFSTEMQYQHLVFEEFARRIQPNIDPFIFSNTADIDPAITAEFAHAVYRFGHSMLTDTIEITDPTLSTQSLSLVEAFLNPQAFGEAGLDPVTGEEDAAIAAGAIIRGMTRVEGSEIDEFVPDSLRNFLVGLPLDLAALNIARGRDAGVAAFNVVRAQLYASTNDSQLKPYTSWLDFAQNIKNPLSIVNFVAAYGTHPLITGETTLEGKRAAATLLVMGGADIVVHANAAMGVEEHVLQAPADRLNFLQSKGNWAPSIVDGVNSHETGLNLVDLWIGGLAEEKMEFGGMLGSTFNYVFEHQLESLQNGDRFYYLSRTQGMNMLNELEKSSFADLVMRNSDLGDVHSTHVDGQIFNTADYILELDPLTPQVTNIGEDGTYLAGGTFDPVWEDSFQQAFDPKVDRIAPGEDVDGDGHDDGGMLKYSGGEHVVLGGTEGNDRLYGDKGIDTLWGDGGDDYLNAGTESDQVYAGDGDDIIEDPFGDDFLRGGEGNDVVSGGSGLDIMFGGGGQDFMVGGTDAKEMFAGRGNDFLLGGSGSDGLMGNEGDDWIEGGDGFDSVTGENSNLFFNSPIIGHDILNGGGNDTDYDGESGDDIMIQGAGIQRNNGMAGFDWVIHQGDTTAANSDLGLSAAVNQQAFTLRDRNDLVEALSGWKYADTLTGRQIPLGLVSTGANFPDLLGDDNPRILGNNLYEDGVRLITGLRELLSFKTWDVNDVDALVMDGSTTDDLLIGGGGADVIKGRAGNDIIDGDAFMHVFISVRENKDGSGPELFRADSLTEIQARLLNGTINPGQLVASREIVYRETVNGYATGAATIGSGMDTAVYIGNRSNFTITLRPDGRVSVVDNVGDEGSDMLRNVERIQFADSVAEINRQHVGSFGIDNVEPEIDQVLTVTTGSFIDYDGTTSFARQWQRQVEGTWVDIAGATDDTYKVTVDDIGQPLRVATNYTDNRGFSTQGTNQPEAVVYSDATMAVAIPDYAILGDEEANALTGTEDADLVFARGGDDTLVGLDGDDRLFGEDGNDSLDGGSGADRMAGGLGDDTYVVDDGGDTVVEGSLGGTDTVTSSISYTLGTEVENLVLGGSSGISGTGNAGNNVLTGNGAANTLTGLAGADFLDGGAGADTMAGGLGDDTYVVDSTGDVVSESGGDGTDTVLSSIAYTLATGLENVTLTGIAALNATGNAAANIVTGNDGDNSLAGLAGDDRLTGGGGNDRLDGGTGADAMAGGLGNDTYTVDNVGDAVDETGGDGVDLVNSSVSFALAAGVDNLTLTGSAAINATGNADANVLTGNAGVNRLTGLDGADTLRGLAGNDQLFGGGGADDLDGGTGADSLSGGTGDDIYTVDSVGDVVDETDGDGVDLVKSSVTFTLAAGVENLTLTGSGSPSATGNAAANILTGNGAANTLTGLDGDDTLIGLSGNDRLNGGAGADILNGGTGSDIMTGGDGDDLYSVDTTGDIVDETASDGIDTVTSSVTYTLGTGVERLTLTGTGGIAGRGNAADNVITGNDGANALSGFAGNDQLFGGAGTDTLDGGTGQDVMSGGRGNDSYVVDDIGDVVDETGGDGLDTVTSSVSFTLGAGVERLTLSGVAAIDATGSADANILTGNAGVNILSGMEGADTLRGMAGNDQLFGGGGADTLDGGTGADVMAGGLGDDIYIVDTLGDSVDETDGDGVDLVTSSITFTLADGLENLTLTGTSGVHGNGNAGANALTGNSAGNILSGFDGDDLLQGLGGNDQLLGGAGQDRLVGGTGSDRLTGGTGDDVFVFVTGQGNDTVVDFDFDAAGGQDLLDVSGCGITAANFGAQVLISQVGVNTVITIGTQTITLTGVNATTIDHSDFGF